MANPRLRNLSGIDYGTLEGAIPNQPRMFPCDLDGLLEVDGSFLFIETKEHDQEFAIGQYMMLDRLSRLPRTTVLIVVVDGKNKTDKGAVWFNPSKVCKVEPKSYTRNGLNIQPNYTETNLEDFKAKLNTWYAEAKANKFDTFGL